MRCLRVARRLLPVGLVVASLSVAAPANAADVLPDLGMMRLTDIQIDKTSSGQRLLRFTSRIANRGPGTFRVQGSRPTTSTSEMTAQQAVRQSDGSWRLVGVTPTMFFAGDGHNHWHLRGLESSDLIRLDNGSKAGAGAKQGFCFYDNTQYNLTLSGAPQSPVYTGCGNQSSLSVLMGLSVGWADEYAYYLGYQYVDVTNLGAGRYRLVVTADPSHYFTEANTSNNSTYVDLQLKAKGGAVSILGYGPNI